MAVRCFLRRPRAALRRAAPCLRRRAAPHLRRAISGSGAPRAAADGGGGGATGGAAGDDGKDANLQSVLDMLDGPPSWSLQELVPDVPQRPVPKGELEELARLAHLSVPRDGREHEELRADIERVLGFLGTVHEAVPSAHRRRLAPSEWLHDGALREDVVSEGGCAEHVLADVALASPPAG